jgi:hypothetical protein
MLNRAQFTAGHSVCQAQLFASDDVTAQYYPDSVPGRFPWGHRQPTSVAMRLYLLQLFHAAILGVGSPTASCGTPVMEQNRECRDPPE